MKHEIFRNKCGKICARSVNCKVPKITEKQKTGLKKKKKEDCCVNKMLIFPKMIIYRFIVILKKTQQVFFLSFFVGIDKLMVKFVQKYEYLR